MTPSAQVNSKLNDMARIAEALQIEDLSFASYATAIEHLSQESFDLRRDALRMDRTEHELQQHLNTAEYELQLITKWLEEFDSPEFANKIEETEHKQVALTLKAQEYQAELDSIPDAEAPITIADFLVQKESLYKKEHEVKIKRAKLQAFQGLPPNLALAKQELQQAREDLIRLSDLRERLLNNMVDEVS